MAAAATGLRLAPEEEDDEIVVSKRKLGELERHLEKMEKEVVSRTPVDLYNHVGWTCPGG
jgi:hypothetical protein